MLDRPFFFFGHSFGAIVAFEVARILLKEYSILNLQTPVALFSLIRTDVAPLCLFASGQSAPHLLKPDSPPASTRDDADLIAYCK